MNAVEEKVTRVLGAIILTLPYLEALEVARHVDHYCPYDGALSHGKVFTIIVLNRLHAPHPLYKLGEWAKECGLGELLGLADPVGQLNDDRLALTLEVVYAQQVEIQAAISLSAIRRFDLALEMIHYDLTSIFFRGLYEDSELLRHGYSRDHLPREKQVVLGLNSTADGEVPLWGQVHPGNTTDATTVVDNLRRLQKLIAQLGDKHSKLLVSGDTILWNGSNMLAVERGGGYFLGPTKLTPRLKQIIARLPESLFRRLPYSDHPSNQAKREPVTYRAAYCRLVFEAVEPEEPKGALTEETRSGDEPVDTKTADKSADKQRAPRVAVRLRVWAGVIWDSALAKEQAADRERAIVRYEEALSLAVGRLNQRRYKKGAYVRERLAAIAGQHKGGEPFVRYELTGEDGTLALRCWREEAAIKEAARLDGKWLLVSNKPPQPEQDKVAYLDWMLSSYRGEKGIERRMRNLKSDSPIRPIFLHNDDRIGGLCLAHLVALQVFALIERDCRRSDKLAREKYTFPKLRDLFATYSITVLRLNDGHEVRLIDTLSPKQHQVLTALGLEIITNRVAFVT